MHESVGMGALICVEDRSTLYMEKSIIFSIKNENLWCGMTDPVQGMLPSIWPCGFNASYRICFLMYFVL